MHLLILSCLDCTKSVTITRSFNPLNYAIFSVLFSLSPITKILFPLHSKFCMLIDKKFDVELVINYVSESQGRIGEIST